MTGDLFGLLFEIVFGKYNTNLTLPIRIIISFHLYDSVNIQICIPQMLFEWLKIAY